MRYREGIARDFLSSKSPNGYPEPISPPRQHLGIVFVQLYMLNDFLKRLIPIISALVLMAYPIAAWALPDAGDSSVSEPLSASVTKSDSQVHSANQLPLFPVDKLKDGRASMRLYQLDESALGNRMPLLLVHGLHGEQSLQGHFSKLIEQLLANDKVNRTYKLYAVRYGSERPLATIAPELQQQMMRLYSMCDHRPLTVMALSFGGNLVEQAMRDSEVNKSVRLVLALGTPFNGSPLFSPDWFQYSMYKNPSFLLSRYYHSLSYRMYISRNPYLVADLRPDNSAGFIPAAGPFQSRVPLGPRGNLSLERAANPKLLELNNEFLQDKHKFVVYAGYLDNQYTRKHGLADRLLSRLASPYMLANDIIKLISGQEHGVFRATNWEMARTICGGKVPSDVHPFCLNDGVTPVASALFLPSSVCKTHYPVNEEALESLKNEIDVGKARAFRNVDHLTFVDGVKPALTSKLAQDQLHPEEGKKEMFDWIIGDLLDKDLPASRVSQAAPRQK